jgi:hypothetical protein
MSMRVDLILQSEQRSASVFTPKMLIRILSFVLPALLLLAVASLVMKVMGLSAEHERLDRDWLKAGPKQEQAIKLTGQLNANRRILDELEGWRKAQMVWHNQLAALPKITPAAVQLTDLNVDQVLEAAEKEKALGRSFTMQLQGRAVGKSADMMVDELENSLKTMSEFAPLIESVEVVSFMADTARGASEDDRLFEIRCKYLPRAF